MKIKELFKQTGIEIKASNNRPVAICVNATLGQVMELLPELKGAQPACNAEQVHYLLAREEHKQVTAWMRNESQLDMTEYDKASDELRQFRERIRAEIPELKQHATRRVRAWSDSDGEWNYERRYDEKAFLHKVKVPSSVKTVTLMANFVANGSASNTDLRRYGAMVYGMAELLESAGIKTRVVVRNWAEYALEDQSGSTMDCRVVVKEPGQYIAPHTLAMTLTGEFYRGGMWPLRIAAIDALGLNAYQNIGRPTDIQLHVDGSTIHLTPNSAMGYSKELITQLKKAVL